MTLVNQMQTDAVVYGLALEEFERRLAKVEKQMAELLELSPRQQQKLRNSAAARREYARKKQNADSANSA